MGLRPPRGPPREKGPFGPHFRTANSATRSTRAINGAAAAAAGRGPGGPQGATPHPGPSALPPGHSAVALAGPLRGPCCAAPVPRSPRFAWLGPVARARAAAASRPRSGVCALASLGGPGPPLLAPRSAARPLVRRCAAPRALAGPVCLRPRSRVAAGSLIGRPCCARPWALCSAWPRGGPLRARFRLRASGRSASPRPGGFGPGGSCARPPAAAPPFFPLRGRALGLRAAAPLAGCLCRCCCTDRGLLPCRPPPGRPRWGLPGARGPYGRLRPRSGSRFSRPSRGPPVARDRAPGAPFSAWLTVPKLSTAP